MKTLNITALYLSLILFSMAACATLPAKVYEGDLGVFDKTKPYYNTVESCGSHLTSLRGTARNRNWLRTLTTILAGSTTAVSGYVASTYADDDPDKSKLSARIALGSGLVAILAQAIPDASEALDDHRNASASWNEARRLALAKGSDAIIYTHLLNCTSNKAPPESLPTQRGEEVR